VFLQVIAAVCDLYLFILADTLPWIIWYISCFWNNIPPSIVSQTGNFMGSFA